MQSPYSQARFLLDNPNMQGEVKYVALGDSLTAGVGSNDEKSTFVYQAGLKLSSQFGTVAVINLGQPGATSEDVILNQLPVAIQEQPTYVTLLIGINDVHNKVRVEDYQKRMTFIVDRLLTRTGASITLINLPYLGSADAVPFPLSIALDARTKQFNKVIAEVGTRDRIKLIDLYTPSLKPFKTNLDYYASDHFHPSGEGYLFWGTIINAD